MPAHNRMTSVDNSSARDELDRILASLGDKAGGSDSHPYATVSAPSPHETIFGSDASEEIQAGNGDDIVMAGGGDDTVWGGYRYKPSELDGNDYLNGGAGKDWLIGGGGDDLIFGGDGDDRLDGVSGNNILNGGAGNDTVYAAGDWNEWGNDIVFGGDGDDLLQGYGDILDGGSGNDRIYDVLPYSVPIFPSVHETTIRGGDGDDVIGVYHRGTVDGGDGYDRLEIDFHNTNYGLEIDFDAERGTTGTGLTFTNIEEFGIQGVMFVDSLRGAAGNDTLVGDGSDDLLEGRGGDDVLQGGNDSDRLIGGAGADTFLWDFETPPDDPNDPWELYPTTLGNEGIDRITDFNTADGDVLQFSYTARSATGIDSYGAFMAAAADTPEGVFIAFNEEGTKGILLEGVARSELSPDDVNL